MSVGKGRFCTKTVGTSACIPAGFTCTHGTSKNKQINPKPLPSDWRAPPSHPCPDHPTAHCFPTLKCRCVTISMRYGGEVYEPAKADALLAQGRIFTIHPGSLLVSARVRHMYVNKCCVQECKRQCNLVCGCGLAVFYGFRGQCAPGCLPGPVRLLNRTPPPAHSCTALIQEMGHWFWLCLCTTDSPSGPDCPTVLPLESLALLSTLN